MHFEDLFGEAKGNFWFCTHTFVSHHHTFFTHSVNAGLSENELLPIWQRLYWIQQGLAVKSIGFTFRKPGVSKVNDVYFHVINAVTTLKCDHKVSQMKVSVENVHVIKFNKNSIKSICDGVKFIFQFVIFGVIDKIDER